MNSKARYEELRRERARIASRWHILIRELPDNMQCALRRLERHEWRETAQLLRTLADWTDEVVALEARCLTVTADIERIQRGQTTMNLPLGPAVARHP